MTNTIALATDTLELEEERLPQRIRRPRHPKSGR
jgi:hypothetical protein